MAIKNPPKPSSTAKELERLRAENSALQTENKQLKQKARPVSPKGSNLLQKRTLYRFTSAILLSFSIALLIAGSILFWAANTALKTDRFSETIAPLIQNTTVQKAIASYTTDQLFTNVDVSGVITNALPARADFLAPSIAGGLKNYTNSTLQNVLANPSFQTTWNNALSRSHAGFIQAVKTNGSDGSIDINEAYQQLSGNLQNTRLAFLAGKPLPHNVGSIQLLSGSWLIALQHVITHIDTWRTLAILLFLLCAAGSIWFSKRRRRGVVRVGIFSVFTLFFLLIALRLTREIVASRVPGAYSEAVREAVQIVFHPLVVQISLTLCAFAIMTFIAWVSGSGRLAAGFRARTNDLLAGKLHAALFGERGENGFTEWLSRYKRIVEWVLVGVIAVVLLLVRLTPATLIGCVIGLLVLVLTVETLAPTSSGSS